MHRHACRGLNETCTHLQRHAGGHFQIGDGQKLRHKHRHMGSKGQGAQVEVTGGIDYGHNQIEGQG